MPFDDRKNHAIGMFDSGVGGLTVMREVKRLLPSEEIVYFGDTARIPYGSKSPETITRYSIENAIFLMEQNIKMLVVACNTASAYSLDKLRQIFNLPVIGVIEPGAEKALRVTRNGRIAVLGTKGTISSGVYQKAIHARQPEAEVIALACPLFVPLIEELFFNNPATRLVIKEYLKPLKEHEVDTILLGCTHYPLLRQLIQEEVGSHVSIVDSASTCAEAVLMLLSRYNLQRQQPISPDRYFVSDDPTKFQSLGCEFFGAPIENVIQTALPSHTH